MWELRLESNIVYGVYTSLRILPITTYRLPNFSLRKWPTLPKLSDKLKEFDV